MRYQGGKSKIAKPIAEVISSTPLNVRGGENLRKSFLWFLRR